jgi:F-type H+-transporting ATPase subunit alpha
VLVVYDDLTSHAYAYREISLLSGVSPGRDSYPGDMFFAHSSLLERAGKIARNHKTLTALPIVLAAGGDITEFLPTNVMSITDGQWILDMNVFKDTMRPAINTGQSVTRVGGAGQSKRQKELSARAISLINAYRQAQEFAHFGSELALEAQRDLVRGKQLYELMGQTPEESYSVLQQDLMLTIVLDSVDVVIDIKKLKAAVRDLPSDLPADPDAKKFDKLKADLLDVSTVELKK